VTVANKLGENIAGCAVLADRGYDSDGFRKSLASNGNTPVIPGRKNRKKPVVYMTRGNPGNAAVPGVCSES
jgi:IS5 family transposase